VSAELTLKHTLAVDLGLVDRLAIRRAFLREAGVGAEGDGFLHADALLLPTRRQRLNAGRLLQRTQLLRVVTARQDREVAFQTGGPCGRGTAEFTIVGRSEELGRLVVSPSEIAGGMIR